MAKNLTAVNIVNVLNQQINKVYNTALPAVNKQSFSSMADQLRAAPDIVRNGWCEGLINLIGLQIVKNRRGYESYFRKLRGEETTGNDIQLIMTNLLTVRSYTPESDADDFFTDEKPDTRAQYISVNYKGVIPLPINEPTLYQAFITEEKFMSYLDSLVLTMYNTLEMTDVNLVKELVNRNIAEGNIRIEAAAKPSDQATALALTNKIKATAGDMSVEMGPGYNLAGCDTFTPAEEGIIFTDTETRAVLETYALPWAFHDDYLSLEKDGQGIVTKTGAFGAVHTMYVDRLAFEIHPVIGFPKMGEFYNGKTLTLKRWLHYWAVYAMSFFNNAIAWAPEASIGITAATLKTLSGSLAANRGETVINQVATITAAQGKIADKFGTWAISGNVSDDTMIDEVSGKLLIAKDETAARITVTWTSHIDNSVTATQTITINGN